MDQNASSLSFHIGTVGFSYADWQGPFYPPATRSADFLSAYATAFDTLELDTTFYGTPPEPRVQKWSQAVPDDFQFCPKTPRQITHDTPLNNAHELMAAFLHALAPLRAAGKLGPILIQFPPSFTFLSHIALQSFLARLPRGFRFAIEFRHRSWLKPATADLLAAHHIAWVAADYSTKPWPMPVTADFLYLRFVGKHHRFPKFDHEYIDPTPQLRAWLQQIHAIAPAKLPPGTPIFALFADDYAGHAPATANRFRALVDMEPRLPQDSASTAQPSLFS